MNMEDIDLKDIPWIVSSANEFMEWLIANSGEDGWTRETLHLPGMYRHTAGWIVYEGLFTDLWMEPWFQNGIKSFVLLALEREGVVRFCQGDTKELLAVVPEGRVFGVEDFLSGESLAYRHDPDEADLCWEPVDAADHVLGEYNPSERQACGVGRAGV